MLGKEQIIEVRVLPENIVRGATYSIDQLSPNTYTHGMFKYPCKFIPEIPRWGIHTYLKKEKGVVLDPFAGSGTTLLEAVISGHEAIGAEIDDVAKLIAQVKATQLSSEQIRELDHVFEGILKAAKSENYEAFRPDIANLDHWFCEETIKELGRMKCAIEKIENHKVRNFFNVCLVSGIKRVSYADDTSPKPYVSGKIKKVPPTAIKEFSSIYRRYKQMVIELMEVENMGHSRIVKGDALNFEITCPIDLAITSPPYINAFDYGRTMRLENLWLETLTEEKLREKKKKYVGTEKINVKKELCDLSILNRSMYLKKYYDSISPVDEKRALIIKKFFEDMEINLKRVKDSLKPGGRYMIVIGNSIIRKVHIESWKVLEELGNCVGFETEEFFNYEIKNPYIRIPRNGMGGKISKDYVLVLKKNEK